MRVAIGDFHHDRGIVADIGYRNHRREQFRSNARQLGQTTNSCRPVVANEALLGIGRHFSGKVDLIGCEKVKE